MTPTLVHGTICSVSVLANTVLVYASISNTANTPPYLHCTPFPTTLDTRISHRWYQSLPLLADIEAPFELEVLLLVVVDKGRDGVVVGAGHEALGGLLLGNCSCVRGGRRWNLGAGGGGELTFLLVDGLLLGVGGVASLLDISYHHHHLAACKPGYPQRTIISESLLTLMPFLFTTCT